MSGINLHTLLGNVGSIETHYTADGKAIVNLSIATSEKWKDSQSGQIQEKTDWNRVVIFGKPAEIIAQYVNKGDKIYLQGKVQTRKWTNNEGIDVYTTETVVDGFNGKFELLGGNRESNNGQANNNQAGQASQQQNTHHQPAQQQTNQDEFDDDIPF